MSGTESKGSFTSELMDDLGFGEYLYLYIKGLVVVEDQNKAKLGAIGVRSSQFNLSTTTLQLIENLLSFDPAYRGTATSALDSEFFTTKPLECDPSSLPKYPPTKEIDAKMREDRIRASFLCCCRERS